MQQGHLKIWQISDGKPGHVKQATALVTALESLRVVEHSILPAWPITKVLSTLMHRRGSGSQQFPGLVLGVGHGTHPTVVALQRQLGARSAVIMNPSLPACLFDAVITPRHDGFVAGGNRIVTPLSLAPVPIDSRPDYSRGLILLGGTSRHFDWNDDTVVSQMTALVDRYPGVHWQATTSRRTPPGFMNLANNLPDAIDLLDWSTLAENWLQQTLPLAGHIWVSEDSASMLAEAMNTRACVGLIRLATSHKDNKLRRGTDVLEAEGLIASLAQPYQVMTDPDGPTDPACGPRQNPNAVCAESLLALLDL